MDKGEFVSGGYEVKIGMNGSYVLVRGSSGDIYNIREMIGFTNWKDLTEFLYDEHQALAEVGKDKASDVDG